MAPERSSRDTNRTIRRAVEDMERCGLITFASEYERPQARPVVAQGTDGGYDLYLPYKWDGAVTEEERAQTLALPFKNCLLDFALSYKRKNPKEILAEGSIQTHYCVWPILEIKSLDGRV
jgi:hypothetical protein